MNHNYLTQLAARAARTTLAVAAGAAIGAGGYALAAPGSSPIHGCIDKHTRVLRVQQRCHAGQSRLVWNNVGPRGLPGPQGPPAAGAWAVVGTRTGGAGVESGRNISVAYLGVGDYRVTAGGPCSSMVGAIEVNPEALSYAAGHVPTAYAAKESGTPNVFDVHVDDVGAGGATPQDGLTLDVTVSCQ